MPTLVTPAARKPVLAIVDPRRSLATGAAWLIVALAVSFATAAAVWVGAIARENLLEQHVRRLALETDQLSSDVGQAIDSRLTALRFVARGLHAESSGDRRGELEELFAQLLRVYPQLDWIAIADAHGRIVDSVGPPPEGGAGTATSWYRAGLEGPWLGVVAGPLHDATASELGCLAAPVRDGTGSVVGVVAAHVSWRRSMNHPQRLTDETDPQIATQAFLLDRERVVLVGPAEFLGKRWSGSPDRNRDTPQFERLASGQRVLVARSTLNASKEVADGGWQVQLSEPEERVYQRSNAVAMRILWVSLGLGLLTAGIGILGARQLTRRLTRLTASVSQVGGHDTDIEVPSGMDEVAQLGRAFAQLLAELRLERRELERRVAIRTREVERLADESRYAAITRERLQIARDLHDTLAHSMMAIVSEIRLLRRLHAKDPAALAGELERAEAVAHEGLAEARKAISQMRLSTVRETGLGPALASAFDKFIERTGLAGEFSADDEAARFGDERAEALLRIALEALRNIEKHAMATRVALRLVIVGGTTLRLTIDDDGVGFDPAVAFPDHFGLVGIREQADLIGAELSIESVRQRGTTVRVSLPLAPVAFTRSA